MKRKECVSPEAPTIDPEAIRSDQRFFARHPDRRYRTRRAFAAERELYVQAHDQGPLPPDLAVFVAVDRAEGRFLRMLYVCPRDMDTDVSEDAARDLFVGLVSDCLWGPA